MIKSTRKIWLVLLLFCISTTISANNPTFSTAGFYTLQDSPREVFSMNNGWRSHKGDIQGADAINFDDSQWRIVSLPDGIELLPENASGGVNYQGITWYRKEAIIPSSLQGKRLNLHFEGIMGKSKIYVNGQLLKEHFGGYLPAIVDITSAVKVGEKCTIAVMADNSNDPLFPPGKPQGALDFTYFGGIYRDTWLIAHNDIFITDPNYEDEVAGGGLFVAYPKVNKQEADIDLKLQLRNVTKKSFSGRLRYELTTLDGEVIKSLERSISIKANSASTFKNEMSVKNPKCWSPEEPNLHYINVIIKNRKGEMVDGYKRRIGIRHTEFRGEEGFFLNGERYTKPLIGANRHQDFAVVGNALTNSMHWRDAKKLRELDFKIIRNAHYTQDPAFMDACDELGLFVIVATPGWQFWTQDPIFEQRVYADIRNMVRRDRNHPSVLLWEPILNETWYPAEFAKNARDFVKAEYPYDTTVSGCDSQAKGAEHFNFVYGGTADAKPERTYFIREWGDNVDNWTAQNSISRCSKALGEIPMMKQMTWYASAVNGLSNSAPRLLGGCLWHPFDHQRGYHPDPFYGGIMDAYRQPKISYKFFETQRPIEQTNDKVSGGAKLYIANEMTPFSPEDVTIFTNCDEVRVQVYDIGEVKSYKRSKENKSHVALPIVFEDLLKWSELRLQYSKPIEKGSTAYVASPFIKTADASRAYILAEGLIDGKVVTTEVKTPAGRAEKLIMWIDNDGMDLIADGSDKVVVVAAIADNEGRIRRIDQHNVKFSISGEGILVTNEECGQNPKKIEWGTAPILVQSTDKAGEITVYAEVLNSGENQPISGSVTFKTVANPRAVICDKSLQPSFESVKQSRTQVDTEIKNLKSENEKLRKTINEIERKKTEVLQKEFQTF